MERKPDKSKKLKKEEKLDKPENTERPEELEKPEKRDSVEPELQGVETLNWSYRYHFFRAFRDDVYCDPESGQMYKLFGNYLKPIPLKDGIAALAKNYYGWDGRKIIHLLVQKHGVESVSKLFAPHIAFDFENHNLLGTILSDPEGRVFQDIHSSDRFTFIRYVEGVSVEKKEYDSLGMELFLRNNMESKRAFSKQIQTILEKKFPNRQEILSSFRIPGTDSIELPPLRESLKDQVQQMSNSFFHDKSPVLLIPSADAASDKYLAMERLLQFMAAVDHEDFKYSSDYDFINQISCYPGVLRLQIRYYETSCYDGGAGGTWDHTEFVELKRLDMDWKRICAGNGLSEDIRKDLPDFFFYRGILPMDDCQCVVGFSTRNSEKLPVFNLQKGVFLRDPFGLQGVYKFSIYWNVV